MHNERPDPQLLGVAETLGSGLQTPSCLSSRCVNTYQATARMQEQLPRTRSFQCIGLTRIVPPLQRLATLERCGLNSHAEVWELAKPTKTLQLPRRAEFNIRPALFGQLQVDPAVGDINQITAAVFGQVVESLIPELFQLGRFVGTYPAHG